MLCAADTWNSKRTDLAGKRLYTIQVSPLPSVEFLVFKFSCNRCSVFRNVPDVARPTVVND